MHIYIVVQDTKSKGQYDEMKQQEDTAELSLINRRFFNSWNNKCPFRNINIFKS
jgi:hypothetical protein